MLARVGDRLSAFFRATAPDPFVIAILLTLVTFLLAIGFGRDPQTGGSLGAPRTVELWQAGFWNLLTFGMQMCLILVTGHALASSPPLARGIRWLAEQARGGRQGVVLTSVVAMLAALLNWGFGLIVGAILAREVTRGLRRKGVRAPAGLLAAAGYTGLLVWHGGLSGSAPLKAASEKDQVEVLGEALGAEIGAIPVSDTLFGTLNLAVTGGLLVIVPLVLALMCPKSIPEDETTVGRSDPEGRSIPVPEAAQPEAGRWPAILERSPAVVWIIALPAFAWLGYRFLSDGFDALTLNTANMLFLTLGMVLHGSAYSYGGAVEDGVRGCAGIIIQFPLYAGIMGMITGSGLGALLSNTFVDAAHGSEAGLSVMTFLSAGLVNLFVPSGGGQWAIQGPIGMQAALDAGISPAKMVMAVSFGDELTNMLQPFWALPLLAITGARVQDVVGYTAVVMLAAGVWMGVWLAVL